MKQDELKNEKKIKRREEKYDKNTGLPRALKERLGVNEEDFEKDTSRGKFAELAQAAGVSVACISQYVHGYTAPSFDVLVKMAKKLNCTTDYLTGLSDVPAASINEDAIAKYTGLHPESIRALHYMKDLRAKMPYWYHENAAKSLSFLDRALRYYYESLLDLDDFVREEQIFDYSTIFCDLEDWVTGSGDSGETKLRNGWIRNDDAFREIAMSNIKEMLLRYAEDDGTFAETKAEYDRLRNEEYERMENEDDTDPEEE